MEDNFFLPDDLLESDSDSDDGGGGSIGGLPAGFVSSGAPAGQEFDAGFPAQSRLLPGISSQAPPAQPSSRCASAPPRRPPTRPPPAVRLLTAQTLWPLAQLHRATSAPV